MNRKEKAGTGTTVASFGNQSFAGGKQKAFDVFNYAENGNEKQCLKCNPPLHKLNGAIKLCANCEAERQETATAFFENFRRYRRVVSLDCYCFACNSPKSKAMMSKVLPICRGCAGELKSKGATAKNNFIARTLNNFHKKLKGQQYESRKF